MQLIIRTLPQTDYLTCFQAMQQFTAQRDENTVDELWFLEHPAVFTQGQAGKAEHLLSASAIPVVQADRGGQITYHGPGQQIVYCLLDIKRLKIGVRELVEHIENAIINTLKDCAIQSYSQADAHGVYVNINNSSHKIASLGLRIRKGCSYHGLALNNDMDLSPFAQINPCGYAGMPMTDIARCGEKQSPQELQEKLVKHLRYNLPYTQEKHYNGLP